jgi:hypothetical protein
VGGVGVWSVCGGLPLCGRGTPAMA